MSLTPRAVASHVTAGVRRDYPDDDPRGLVLRVAERSRSTWAVRYKYRGADRRFKLGKVKVRELDDGLTLAEARRAARAILGRVAQGEDPQGERVATRRAPRPARAATIRALGAEALKHLKVKPATRVEYERIANVDIYPELGDLQADQLTRRRIREWAEGIDSKAAANHAFGVLRRFYSVAVERDMIAASPFVLLKKPHRSKASERVLSPGELWALQRALDELEAERDEGLRTKSHWEGTAWRAAWTAGEGPAVVRLLLLTGVRRGMVLGARREEFEDLEAADPRWVIPGDRTKNGRPHVVPLSRQAVDLVRARLAGAGGAAVLFPAGEQRPGRRARSETAVWKSAFVRRLRRRVDGLLTKPAPAWTIHNLRQTIGTHLREQIGVRGDVVSLILSHTVAEGAAVTRIYNRAQLMPERRDALARWARWLEELPEPGKVLAFPATGDAPGTP